MRSEYQQGFLDGFREGRRAAPMKRLCLTDVKALVDQYDSKKINKAKLIFELSKSIK